MRTFAMRLLPAAPALAVSLLVALPSCNTSAPPQKDSSTQKASAAASASVAAAASAAVSAPTATAAPTHAGAAVPIASASAAPSPLSTAFVHLPEGDRGHPVDACLPHGGNYFSCRGVYEREKDPIQKRYMLRIARGLVAGEKSYRSKDEPMEGGMPHAEVPGMCDPRKPCDSPDGSNGSFTCLARALEAMLKHQPAAARAAHIHACKCHPKENTFIGYNASAYICDERGRPAFLAPNLPKKEGKDIVACASCDAKEGPAACQREIERLQKKDAPLADYIRTKQIPRCRVPPPPYQ